MGWLFILILLVILAGIIYGYFTRRGSGIQDHPRHGDHTPPGAAGRSEPSGKDQGEPTTLRDHGTR